MYNKKCDVKSKGFTLVELMIVLSIVGIMAALAAPAMKNWFDRWEMKSTSNTIVSVFSTARAYAMNHGTVPIEFAQHNSLDYKKWQVKYSNTTEGKKENLLDVLIDNDVKVIASDTPTLPIKYYKYKRGTSLNKDLVFTVCKPGSGIVAYEVVVRKNGIVELERGSTLC